MEKERDTQISQKALEAIRVMQQTEITEYATYKAIASRLKDGKNKQVLNRLAEEELVHCNIWKKYTGEEIKP